MVTGDLKSKVAKVWEAFWSGGISNGLLVIDQITYLLFVKRLDELHTAREKKANLLKKDIEALIFLDTEEKQKLCWSRFKVLGDLEKMFEQVFPFIKETLPSRQFGGVDSSYSRFMKDAVFVIRAPSLFARVVDMLEDIPIEDRDTKADIYEYLLAKIASAGRNGQFHTPRHIIRMMVQLAAPIPDYIIADPACGTCGSLVEAGEYLRNVHSYLSHNDKQRKHYNSTMFNGFDFDASMLRIGAMSMVLHGTQFGGNRGSLCR